VRTDVVVVGRRLRPAHKYRSSVNNCNNCCVRLPPLNRRHRRPYQRSLPPGHSAAVVVVVRVSRGGRTDRLADYDSPSPTCIACLSVLVSVLFAAVRCAPLSRVLSCNILYYYVPFQSVRRRTDDTVNNAPWKPFCCTFSRRWPCPASGRCPCTPTTTVIRAYRSRSPNVSTITVRRPPTVPGPNERCWLRRHRRRYCPAFPTETWRPKWVFATTC